MPNSVQIETPGDIDLKALQSASSKSPTHRSSRYWLTAMPLVDLDEIDPDSGRVIEFGKVDQNWKTERKIPSLFASQPAL
jgi:hypothetical protein